MQSSGETGMRERDTLRSPCRGIFLAFMACGGVASPPQRPWQRDGWRHGGTQRSTGCTGCSFPGSIRARPRRCRASHRRRRPGGRCRPHASSKVETGSWSPCCCVDGVQDVLDEADHFGAALRSCFVNRGIRGVGPGGGHLDLVDGVNAGIDGACSSSATMSSPLLAVGFLSGFLHVLHRIVDGDDVGQLEESGLQDGVGALAQADLAGPCRWRRWCRT